MSCLPIPLAGRRLNRSGSHQRSSAPLQQRIKVKNWFQSWQMKPTQSLAVMKTANCTTPGNFLLVKHILFPFTFFHLLDYYQITKTALLTYSSASRYSFLTLPISKKEISCSASLNHCFYLPSLLQVCFDTFNSVD